MPFACLQPVAVADVGPKVVGPVDPRLVLSVATAASAAQVAVGKPVGPVSPAQCAISMDQGG